MSKMIISPRTIQLLKNFSTINQSLVVKPGGVLSTMSPGRTVLAYARIDEDFEVHVWNIRSSEVTVGYVSVQGTKYCYS